MADDVRRDLVVDAHIHIGSFPVLEGLSGKLSTREDIVGFRTRHPELFGRQRIEEPTDNSDRLIEALDEHGIDVGVVMARPGVSNDLVAEMAGRHPDRLIPLMRLGSDQQLHGYVSDPSPVRIAAPAEIDRCVEEYGVKGIGEIFPRSLTRSIHPEEIADELDGIMERVVVHSIPISFPTAWNQWRGGLYYSDPIWVDELAGRFPEARILLTKMGRGVDSIFDSVYAIVLRNSNVYVDMTHASPKHLRILVEAIGPDRVLFGSDWSATWQYLSRPEDVHSLAFGILEAAGLEQGARTTILTKSASDFFDLV